MSYVGGRQVTLTQLQEACIARQKEWDPNSRITLSYRGNEMAGEVGEACNVIKKIERENYGIRGTRATDEDLGFELADVIITAVLVAIHQGIDMDAMVEKKFNMTSEKYNLKTRL